MAKHREVLDKEEIIDRLVFAIEENFVLGRGRNAIVYNLGNIAAKVYFPHVSNETIQKEFSYCTKLYSLGVSVPEMYYYCDYEGLGQVNFMERIKGKTLERIKPTRRAFLQHLIDQETKKAESLGFKFPNVRSKDVLYERTEGQYKITLIGFSNWRYTEPTTIFQTIFPRLSALFSF